MKKILLIFIILLMKNYVLAEGDPLFNPYSMEGLHYVWAGYDGHDTEIYYSYWDGKKWAGIQQITDNLSNDLSPTLALDKDKNPWIVWSGEDGVSSSIYCRYWDGQRWSSIVQVSEVNIYEDTLPMIAFDNKNIPWVVWCGNDGVDDDIYVSSYSYSKKGWINHGMVNSDDNTPDITPVLCFDIYNNAVVVWSGYDMGNYQLYFSQRQDKIWTNEKVVAKGPFSDNLPILLKGRDDVIKLLWSQKNRYYKAIWDGQGWSSPGEIQVLIQKDFFDRLDINTIGPGYIVWITDGIPQGMKIFYPDKTVKNPQFVVSWIGRILNWVEGEIDPSAVAEVEPNKYIAFGDSITWGYGAQTEGYPPRLERKLNERIGPSIVVNEGLGGETTVGGLERIDEVLRSDNAQFLLLMEGTNDVSRGYSTDTIIFNLGVMVDKTMAYGTTPLLASLTPRIDGWAHYVESVINPAISNLASEKKVTYVDQYTEMNANKESYLIDHVHPNDAGYELMAEIWFKAIDNILNPPGKDDGSGCGAVPPMYFNKTSGGLYKNLEFLFAILLIILFLKKHAYQ